MNTTKTDLKRTEVGIFPVEWSVGSLGDNAERIFVGRDPMGGKQSHSEKRTEYRIVQSAPVFDGYLDANKAGYISAKLFSEFQSAAIEENDVLLNQLGDGVTFARSCVVPKGILPAIITRSVGCIRCNRQRLDPWFLNAYLILPMTKKYIESFNSGSSRRGIDGGKMRSFIIPLPPLAEQMRIGSFYKAIQDKIALNQQMNKTVEAIAKAVFRHWFVDFEFPNVEDKPYKSSGGEMIMSELGEIPKGWRVGVVPEIAEVVYGYAFNSKLFNGERGFQLVRIRDLPADKSGTLTTEDFGEKYVIRKGDIVSGMDGEFRTFLWKGHDALQNQRICKFIGRSEQFSNAFIYFAISNPLRTIERAKVGTTVIHLSKTDIDSTKIVIPTQAVLEKYNEVSVPLLERMVSNTQETLNLVELRDLLLPKLMSGKIRAPIGVR